MEHRNAFSFEIIDENKMRPSLDKVLKNLLCACFPKDREVFLKTRYWNGVSPAYSIIAKNGQRIIGHVGIVARTVEWNGERIVSAGIQSLCVSPDYRGKGLAKQLLLEAMKEAKQRGFLAGLLFCEPELEPFYRKEGWEEVSGRVFHENENGIMNEFSNSYTTMYLSLQKKITNAGDLDLRGIDW